MEYYSTKQQSPIVGLRDAVIDCMPSDGGLYMPEALPVIPKAFINNMPDMNLREIAYVTTNMFLGSDVDSATLKKIVDESMNFEVPLVRLSDRRYALELFHGPTMAFKDFGAMFMSRLVQSFNPHDGTKLNVLVATTGNTGAAVAKGFSEAPDVNVFVLYPQNHRLPDMYPRLIDVGSNVHAVEVGGSIDDCKAMVSAAFADAALREKLLLTSANSVNFARLMPQLALFFYAYAQLMSAGADASAADIALPSGNLGMLTAGLLARRAGLTCGHLIAACNANNTFDVLMKTGRLVKRPTVSTLARFMDMSMPSNLPRLMDLCDGDTSRLRGEVDSASVSDQLIEQTISCTYEMTGYQTEPHAAVGLAALDMRSDAERPGVVFATAHPALSRRTVERLTGCSVAGAKTADKATSTPTGKAVKLPATYPALRKYLLANQ